MRLSWGERKHLFYLSSATIRPDYTELNGIRYGKYYMKQSSSLEGKGVQKIPFPHLNLKPERFAIKWKQLSLHPAVKKRQFFPTLCKIRVFLCIC